jgi:hypothetical protein
MPEPRPLPSPRAAAIHAAEARFRAGAADIVSLVLRRAHGGDPVCLRLCLERAPPAGGMRSRRATTPFVTGAPRGPTASRRIIKQNTEETP